MPNPSASSPDLPALHGHTHRPKAQGGTDPIEFPAASDLTWCLASCSTATVSAASGTYYPFTFDSLYTNDSAAFEAVDVTSLRAAYIQVNTPGYYVWKAQIFKASGTFGGGANDIWLEPAVVIGGSRGNIQGNQGIADFLGAYFSAATRIKTSGDPHEQLWGEVTFNYDPDNPTSDIDFENPLKVGLNLAESGGPSSYVMAASMFLMRIASPGYVDLSPV